MTKEGFDALYAIANEIACDSRVDLVDSERRIRLYHALDLATGGGWSGCSPKPKVFRNKNFTKRDYECTNIAACSIVDEGARVPENYEPADESLIANMQPLWIEGGIRYWGWL